MSNFKTKLILCMVLAAMALTMAPAARADQWNQRTLFTFNGPVAIPGQVLPAGSYVFKLLDSASNRHVVQVFNQDEDHIYGTFLAIPDYRMHPSGEPLIKFHESAAGQPQAVRAWFYPGRTYGHEFVYPKSTAVELARSNQTPVPAMPSELAPDTVVPDVKTNAPEVMAMLAAPVMAEEPTGEEVPLETAFATTPETVVMPEQPAEELPETASVLPSIAILGGLFVAAAAALRVHAGGKTKESR